MTHGRVLGAAACALLLTGAPAWAQHAANNGKKDEKTVTAPGNSGQTAAVDQDGRLRPISNDEIQELLAGMGRALSQSSEGLAPVYHPNGAVSVDLDGRFESVMLARATTDGKAVTECVTTKDEAKAFLTRSAAKAGAEPITKAPTAKPAVTPALEEK